MEPDQERVRRMCCKRHRNHNWPYSKQLMIWQSRVSSFQVGYAYLVQSSLEAYRKSSCLYSSSFHSCSSTPYWCSPYCHFLEHAWQLVVQIVVLMHQKPYFLHPLSSWFVRDSAYWHLISRDWVAVVYGHPWICWRRAHVAYCSWDCCEFWTKCLERLWLSCQLLPLPGFSQNVLRQRLTLQPVCPQREYFLEFGSPFSFGLRTCENWSHTALCTRLWSPTLL